MPALKEQRDEENHIRAVPRIEENAVFIPKEYAPIINKMLSILSEKGADANHKMELLQIAGKIIERGGQFSPHNSLSWLSDTISSNSFKLDLLPHLRSMIELSGNDTQVTIMCFSSLLANKNFAGRIDQSVVVKVSHLLSENEERAPEKRFLQFSLANMFINENIKPENLAQLAEISNAGGKNTPVAFKLFGLVLENKNFKWNYVNSEFVDQLIKSAAAFAETFDSAIMDYAFQIGDTLFRREDVTPMAIYDLPKITKAITAYFEGLDSGDILIAANIASNRISGDHDKWSIAQEIENLQLSSDIKNYLSSYHAAEGVFGKDFEYTRIVLDNMFLGHNFEEFEKVILPNSKKINAIFRKIEDAIKETDEKSRKQLQEAKGYFAGILSSENFRLEHLNYISQVLDHCGQGPSHGLLAIYKVMGLENFGKVRFGLLDECMRIPGTSDAFNYTMQAIATAITHNHSFREKLPEIIENFENGRKLAKSLGIIYDDKLIIPKEGKRFGIISMGTEVNTIHRTLNIAYALAVIGEEKTGELYRKNGIQYFIRYSKETLEHTHANLDPSINKEKPALIVVFNKADHNAAFIREGSNLEGNTKFYRQMIYEADNEASAYDFVLEHLEKFGKVETWIIGGHGETNSILMGYQRKNPERGLIDLSDVEEISRLKDAFISKPSIILLSCSTGKDEKAIGGILSHTLNARLFAPKNPSSTTNYDRDENGRILNVTYSVETSLFEEGKLMVPRK